MVTSSEKRKKKDTVDKVKKEDDDTEKVETQDDDTEKEKKDKSIEKKPKKMKGYPICIHDGRSSEMKYSFVKPSPIHRAECYGAPTARARARAQPTARVRIFTCLTIRLRMPVCWYSEVADTWDKCSKHNGPFGVGVVPVRRNELSLYDSVTPPLGLPSPEEW